MHRFLFAIRLLFIFGIALSLGTPVAAQDATPGPALAPIPAITPRDGDPLRVMTTTPLLADLVRQIGGDRVQVTSVIPANADPHDFEPTPKEIVAAEDAGLIIRHGLHLDDWSADLIDNSGTKSPVVVATANITTIASSEADFADGDPHVWFDPANVKTMTSTITDALSQADPDGATGYAARRDAFHAQLDALDAWIRQQIATIPEERRKLVTNHDALGYYVRTYGLTFVGSVIPSLDSRAEPSAKETADLIAKIRAEGVPAIFTESTINPRLEKELAKEAGVKVIPNLYADTLGPEGSGADNYIGMMIWDTNLIVGGLVQP